MRKGGPVIPVNPLSYHGTDVFRWIEDEGQRDYRVKPPMSIALPGYFDGVAVDHPSGLSIRRCTLYVPQGLRFDGASGPAVDGIRNMLAALVHDCLYTLKEAGLLKGVSYAAIDRLYMLICVAQNAGDARAMAHYAMLRLFGWFWRLVKKVKKGLSQ